MENPSVSLHIDQQHFEFPTLTGTEQEKAIDIGKLLETTGYITLDSGYKNTGATTSKITFMDGDRGILRHRGYAIEDLAEKSSFLEIAYLLIYGELPKTNELENFTKNVLAHQEMPETLIKIIEAFPKTAHPMSILSAAAVALTAVFPEENNDQMILRLIGIFPVLAANIQRHRLGKSMKSVEKNQSYVGGFLQLLTDEKTDQTVEEALEKLFILHADHEQNCSTSTVRLVGSSHASLYAAISAGVNALWGPLHGGANQAVIEMLEQIQEDQKKGGKIEDWILKAKDKNSGFRLMGFGHRVYKNFDPRAKIIKKAADQVFIKLGVHDPALDIAKTLENEALQDDYFVARKLYPNVDFYSGIIYRALGIPTDLFTVMFALGRLPGWIAQWKEMRENKEPIGRPRQVYMGEKLRPYKAITER